MLMAITVTIVSSFYQPESFMERLAVKISNVIQILFLIGLLISYQQYIDNNKSQNLEHQITLVEKNWSEIFKLIQNNRTSCPNFVNSLSYPWQRPPGLTNIVDSSAQDSFQAIQNLSIAIFQSMENVIIYFITYDVADNLSLWISAFVIWCNSDTLYEMWKRFGFMYDSSTASFIDKIFEEVRKQRPQNAQEALALSEKICTSNTVRQIFRAYGREPVCK